MDFLRNVIARTATLPFSIGNRIDHGETIWSIHDGNKRDDGTECTVFIFECSQRSRLPLARNALRNVKTLRHPGLLNLFDGVETDSHIYIVTEPVFLLDTNKMNTEIKKWGLHNVATTLSFINGEANSVHANIRSCSIFVSRAGEWKLGGLELLTRLDAEEKILEHHASSLPDIFRYTPPEVSKVGWSQVKPSIDSWMLGCLIYESFNSGIASSEQLSNTRAIPNEMVQVYRRLLHTNPKARLSTSAFLNQGSKSFFNTKLVNAVTFVQTMGARDATEREEFLNGLGSVESFPPDFVRHKIVPELLKSFEFGNGGAKVLSAALTVAESFPVSTFEAQITCCIARAFTLQDRSMRLTLLEALPRLVRHLLGKVISASIFPELVAGFQDPQPLIREATVKNILVIVDHLNERQKNNELLKGLSRTQVDEQPGIRTNTTICLGRIANHLNPQTRGKVLVAAFTRSLKDPFVPSRNAALMALNATAELYTIEDCSLRIIPNISPLLIDKEINIRNQAGNAMTTFLNRTKALASSLPDTTVSPASSRSATPRLGTPGEGWSTWAFTSLKDKVGNVSSGVIDRVVDASDRASSAPAVSVANAEIGLGSNGSLPSNNGSSAGAISPEPGEIKAEMGRMAVSDAIAVKSVKTGKTNPMAKGTRSTLAKSQNPFAEISPKRISKPLPKPKKPDLSLNENEEALKNGVDWDAWEA